MARNRVHHVLVSGLTLALALTLATAGSLSPAQADSTTTLDFDAIASGTAVGTQYAGQGVTFVETAGALGSTGLPFTLANAPLAHTDSNVVESSCFGCEFVPHSIRANLATTAKLITAYVSSGCTSATVSLRGYRASGDVVATDSALVGDTAMTLLTISDTAGSDIAFVRFFDDQPGCQIRVDTLSVTLPDTGPPADMALSTSASIVTVAAGAPQTVPIDVVRVNGSNGNVDLDLSGHGLGVDALFSPNPITGTGTSSQLMLSATPAAPFDETGLTEVTVTGTPVSPAVAPAPRTTTFRLRVVPTLTSFSPTSMTAPICGTATGTVYQGRVAGYTGTVTLGATGVPAGVTVSFTPPSDADGGTNPSPHEMRVSPSPSATPGASTLTVRGTGAGATTRTDTTALTVTAMQFTEVPASAAPGQAVTLRSSGFCPGSEFRFGNDRATVTPAADAYNADLTRVQVTVPRLATTGPVRVRASGTQVGASSPVTIREFRQQSGFSFVNNYPNHPMNHAILERTYGRNETNLSIDLCWPFGCQIVSDWIDPLAWVFMQIANGVLTSGSCFGIAMTGQRIAKGHEPISRFAPSGATTPWQLNSPTGPAPTLRNTISGWHSVQLSTQFIQKWAREFVNNAVQPAEILRSRFSAVSPTNPAMVSIKDGSSGHAFIAYGFRSLGGGAWEVDINDPNVPYGTGEETDLSGDTHLNALNASTLHFDGAGNWTYPDLGWSGGKASVALVPMSEWPRDPSMPTGIRDLVSLIVPFGDAPAGTVTDDEGHTLAADGSGDLPGQTLPMLSGPDDHQVAVLGDGTGPLNDSVPNTTGRTYGQGLVGPGLAARVDGIEATAGQTDLVGSDAGSGTVWLDPAGAAGDLEVEVARQESGKKGGQRLADLELSGLDADRLSVSVPRGDGALVVDNAGGTTTLRGTVGRSGPGGLPGTIRLPATTLEPGEQLRVKPRNWTDLATRPTVVQVLDAGGEVVSQETVRPATPDLLRKTSATLRTAKDTKRVLVVKARADRLPEGSQLVQKVQILRGGKVVKTVQRDQSWRGGKSSWKAKVKLPDGRYKLVLVSAAAVFRNGIPTSDVARRTTEVRLR